jgi:hypothetical protein
MNFEFKDFSKLKAQFWKNTKGLWDIAFVRADGIAA